MYCTLREKTKSQQEIPKFTEGRVKEVNWGWSLQEGGGVGRRGCSWGEWVELGGWLDGCSTVFSEIPGADCESEELNIPERDCSKKGKVVPTHFVPFYHPSFLILYYRIPTVSRLVTSLNRLLNSRPEHYSRWRRTRILIRKTFGSNHLFNQQLEWGIIEVFFLSGLFFHDSFI